MNYEWDSEKEEINIRKHHIDFSMAVKALETGDIICDFYDEISSATAGEDRYIAIVAIGAFLLIVYTMRQSDTVTRIISARKLEKQEVRNYVGNIQPRKTRKNSNRKRD